VKIQRVRAISRKEFLHLIRDPRSLGLGIAIPMLMLILFGFALTLDVTNVPVVVWDQSGTETSRELISKFGGSRYFSIRFHVDRYDDVERTIDQAKALAGLVIPYDFARQIETGQVAYVQLLLDGSDSNTANIALNYANAVVGSYSKQISVQRLHVKGINPPIAPADLRARVWFNADLESRNYIIPGLIAVIMMVIAGMLTSLTVAKEWDTGTMEQLISTPVKVPELIIGKLVPYFCIAMFDVILAVLMGEFVFKIPMRGNPVLLFAISAIFLCGALSMGILISIATRTQLLASQLAMIATFLPTFLLSGFTFDTANMPAAIQAVSHIIPAKYFITFLKGLYLKGVGIKVLFFEVLFLIIYALVLMAIANVKFKKKIV
jgi:ABC-2 type transport system permease protein